MKVNIKKNNCRNSVFVLALILGVTQTIAYLSISVLATIAFVHSDDIKDKTIIAGLSLCLLFVSKIVGSNASLINVNFEEETTEV